MKKKNDIVEDIFGLANTKPVAVTKESKIKINLSETIIKTKDLKIKGIDFFIGQRVRMKDNINRIKQSQLVEILSVNKNNEIQVVSVYDGSKVYVDISQLDFN